MTTEIIVNPNNPQEIDMVLATIRQQETGGSPDSYTKIGASSSRDAGAYQFITSTWQGVTNKYQIGTEYPTADAAPPAIQDAVARAYVTDILKNNGGKLSSVPTAWNGTRPGYVNQWMDRAVAVWKSGVVIDSTSVPTDTSQPSPPTASTGDILSSTAKQAANAIPNPISSVTDFLQRITNVKLWQRIGIGVIGALILLFIISKLVSESDTVHTVASAAGDVAKAA